MVDESGLPEVVLVVFLGEASDDNGQASVDEPVDLALFCCDEARELVYVHGYVCCYFSVNGGCGRCAILDAMNRRRAGMACSEVVPRGLQPRERQVRPRETR